MKTQERKKIISVKNVSFTYAKNTPFEKKALEDINLDFYGNEYTAIIGATGSGKSTLIQHLNGLLKPDKGEVTVDGIDTKDKKAQGDLRRKVGLVFQYAQYQLFEETVYKDIEFGLIKRNVPEEERKKRVPEAAKLAGLTEENLKVSPYDLSGGQKKRAAIAGILVLKPEILVLDEPAAGLDPEGTRELFATIQNLHKSKECTVILVAHSMELVALYAERIIVLDQGKVVMDGTRDEVFGNEEKLLSLGLDIPEITKVMKKVKEKHPNINDRIYTVDDAKEEILKNLAK
ncbi:MAG: Energy-coupling factor transporter ATP-binding protein EcfA2 [Firmicutes bacterium ADurb.Bin099]|jgi:energy-coupling factor transport system ATP-binding protein|nr:MAG: Energy-coupling factor transporter ATP-binding protein EcfA2 [Firmicutes bacterium ADurb.Bin099]HPY98990.1 energy-coupling factor transporter ATPase [Clostridia bacterium]HQC68936.1 energy-coupling factor transporter ATPase [Clostridia bacterium]